MQFVWLAGLLITCIAGFLIGQEILRSRRLSRRLQQEFGQTPEPAYGSWFESIPCYWQELLQAQRPRHYIDKITWNDLDMDQVFRRIDACQTSVGQEYLYALLHLPAFHAESLQKREEMIAFFRDNPQQRLEVQKTLARFGKLRYNGVPQFLFHIEAKGLPYPILYRILSVLPLAALVAGFFLPQLFLAFSGACLLNGIVYYQTKRSVEGELTTVRYMGAMLWCCNKLLKQEGSAAFLADTRQAFQTFRPFAAKMSGMMQQSASEADFLTDYLKILFLYDLRSYQKVIRAISHQKEAFHSLYKALGELDACISIASFRESLPGYCLPCFTECASVNTKGIWHPLLDNPVANDADIAQDSLITGSNASGKSTFIKALAVNSILAQTIHTCTAKSYQTRFVLTVTSMAVRDDVVEGDSYFIAEIKSLRRVIDKTAQLPCLCFVDEILKGTNTVERIAASATVLSFLHRQDSLCIVASHDIELTEILKGKFDNYHFREQVTDEGVTFDYRLQPGPSRTRNAIRLLAFMAFDGEIVGKAEKMVSRFEAEGKWPKDISAEKANAQ